MQPSPFSPPAPLFHAHLISPAAQDLDLLVGLRAHAKNPELHRAWAAVKAEKKAQLAAYVKTHMGLDLPTDALYDVQVKRIHEYKRQLMNILSVIHRYHRIKVCAGFASA